MRSSISLLLMAFVSTVWAAPAKKVTLLRTPNHGIQPQAMLDDEGTLHLIYFKGNPRGGNLFYVKRLTGGKGFSEPLRVNSQPGSAVAAGNVRGGHIAAGPNGKVHVAWMGSQHAKPRGPGKHASPMLYARLNEKGTAFEPQRNIIQVAYGLDGGGSLAADSKGNVYVCWHAPLPGKHGESHRRIWVARSRDHGKTFAKETVAFNKPTGCCGCCGMRAFADSAGNVYVLFRSATEQVHRDSWLLISTDQGKTFHGSKVHPWEVTHCPVSSWGFAESKNGAWAAWETEAEMYLAKVDRKTGKVSEPVKATGQGRPPRKHPAVAENAKGEAILVWTEGMRWGQPGRLAWQVYDASVKPLKEHGRANGVPRWSVPTVVPNGNGFLIIY